ncbi:MAG: aspartate kinase [Bacteroidales bacterium]|nr:aspartate kinase [Bacteroidales bacterium]
MIVYKFGGASVNSAKSVRNAAEIVKRQGEAPMVIVISAMGKSTNALEQMLPQTCNVREREERLKKLYDYHRQIVLDLYGENSGPALSAIDSLFIQLDHELSLPPTDYNNDYDRIVCFGELISTTIVSNYFNHIGIANRWMDARNLIRTNCTHREGRIDWTTTQKNISALGATLRDDSTTLIAITQGFIGGADDGSTTTLGREGSDYSAAVFAFCLDASKMVIWKDVPGFLNADPHFFNNTIKIDQMPYNEAIELSYHGASVIHPKTVKPLQNKEIPLYVKSFLTPEAEGSIVGPFKHLKPSTPLYIIRPNQTLLSIATRDFSFIAEDGLQQIFGHFASAGIRINMMQNSALSFSACIDHNELLLHELIEHLNPSYNVRYNSGLHLITIRYYTQEIIDHIVNGRTILLEQRSRITEQVVVDAND